MPLTESIREVLRKQARLSVAVETLESDSNLYLAGMTSHATVNVMLALENEFEIEFPDVMLRRGVFESIRTIETAISALCAGNARLTG